MKNPRRIGNAGGSVEVEGLATSAHDAPVAGGAAIKFGLTPLQVTHALIIARDVAGQIAERRRRHYEITGEHEPPHPGLAELLLRRQPHLPGPGGRGRPKELARLLLKRVRLWTL